MTPQEAWDAIVPLTKLGQALGELETIEIDVPETDRRARASRPVRIDLQRLFYWHVCQDCSTDPDLTLDEMNAHQLRLVRAGATRTASRPKRSAHGARRRGLEIEHEDVQEAGITVVARKRR